MGCTNLNEPRDIYVHADLNGASSVVIKNPTGAPVPPKTLNEAGSMAVCYSVAWEAKVLANAYWVYHDQVSKQAPTGEYIGTGSFMIRGKKNFLPQTALVFGLALMYKLDEGSIFRHEDDRKVRTLEEDEIEIRAHRDDAENEEDIVMSDGEEEQDEPVDTLAVVVEETTESLPATKLEPNMVEFPDTTFQLKINPDLKAEPLRDDSESSDSESESDEEDGASESIKPEPGNRDSNNPSLPGNKVNVGDRSAKAQKNPNSGDKQQQANTKSGSVKKGQKARLNKIKTKYKDQDDEDRELALQLLGSAGNEGKNKKKSELRKEKKDKKQENQKNQQQNAKKVIKKSDVFIRAAVVEAPQAETTASDSVEVVRQEVAAVAVAAVVEENDGNEEFSEQQIEIDRALLSSLTGQPLEDDELLFTMIVCAPYSCVTNYKHKLKLTPGTAKRGKAIKTAVEMFLRDKATTLKEKELIKANLTKDQDGRNLPGKVKISAPNLNKLTKKK